MQFRARCFAAFGCLAGSARRVSCQGRPIAAAAPRNGPGFEQESRGRGLVRSATRDGYAVQLTAASAFRGRDPQAKTRRTGLPVRPDVPPSSTSPTVNQRPRTRAIPSFSTEPAGSGHSSNELRPLVSANRASGGPRTGKSRGEPLNGRIG